MKFRSLLELDARLSSQVRVAEKPGFLRTLAILFAHSGDSWFWAAALIAVWFFGDPFWRKWAAVEFLGVAGLIVVVLIVKILVQRKRPAGEWGSIYRNTDPHSFPSGHAARAFLIAVIASALAPPWLALLLWLWAPLVALARAAMGVHYLSDVVVGAALGIVVALLGLQIYQPLMERLASLSGLAFW